MNKTLYIDNYRGFQDTFILIKDINFLVGENSTGKTSILSLIKMLGSPPFWFSQSFNSFEVNLGSFRDIISAQRDKNNSFFSIGVIEPENPKNYQAYLMKFVERNNKPQLIQFIHICRKGMTKFLFSSNEVRYIFSHLSNVPTYENILTLFTQLAGEKIQNEREYIFLERIHNFEREEILIHINRYIKKIRGENISDEKFVFRILVPEFCSNTVWIAPVRSKPRRTYDEYKLDFNPEGEHTPYLIKKLLNQRKVSSDFRKYLEKFGKESGLFESIIIKGYGRELTAPFGINIVLNNLPLPLKNVGYGVSQSLPVAVELFARPPRTIFAIQQPEVHLHPKAQAALGDIIFNLANEESKRFFIETHSDYTIDRFRLCCKRNNHDFSSQVLFFQRTPFGNKVESIEILNDGEYSENQPSEFREFFIDEEINLLGL